MTAVIFRHPPGRAMNEQRVCGQDQVPALVARAQSGDADAWNVLVNRYAPLVASVIRGFRVYGADADDVGQVVWLRLVEPLADLHEPNAIARWIVTITRH